MAYSQYSEHRRPTAVPKVKRVEHYDATDVADMKNRKRYEAELEKNADEQRKQNEPKKRSFAELIKKKK